MPRAAQPSENLELPEADRLEGFPHPRFTQQLFGHQLAVERLATAFAAGRLHHAWLLAGPEGVGKATLAYRLARHVLAPARAPEAGSVTLAGNVQSPTARQIAQLSHPGLLVLRRPFDPRAKRFSSTIPVEEVRRLGAFFGLTADQGAWRVVIIDSAEDLNPNAANALLKALEEPPPRAVFLLVAAQPSAVLPTLRSRCIRLDLAPLAGANLRRAVELALAAAGREAPAPEDWARLERLSRGSVRKALQLTAAGGLALAASVERLIRALPSLDWGAAHALADSLAPLAQEQRYEAFFDLLLSDLARLVRVRATGLGAADERALAERLIRLEALPRWAELWEGLLRAKRDTDTLNLDRKALILAALARLEALCHT
jgi:DNA polymerase-3 subunit delta'